MPAEPSGLTGPTKPGHSDVSAASVETSGAITLPARFGRDCVPLVQRFSVTLAVEESGDNQLTSLSGA